MRPDLLDCLACPCCRRPALTAEVTCEKAGEVEAGTIACSCGARFPVDRFVPSFFDTDRAAPADARMLADGEYWSHFYTYYEDLGYRYFVDSRVECAPLIFQGILRTVRLGRWRAYAHWHEPHYRDLLGPRTLGTIHDGARTLELGCGGGWLSLELARRGLRVIGQDTALEALVRAKRQAMADGVDAEYIHASSLALPLRPASLDLFVGFQALHHFEDLPATLARVNEALRDDGRVIVFEHRRSRPPKLGKIAIAADRLCLPVIRWRDPATGRADWTTSPNEDQALAGMDAAIRAAFAVEYERSYSLLLQQVPVYAYFLAFERPSAYVAASVVVNALDRLLAAALPDRCEHRLYVGRKRTAGPRRA